MCAATPSRDCPRTKGTHFPPRVCQWLYLIFTIVVLDFLHDAWFYWTHRLLHWKPLYRHVHHLHHR